MILIAYDASDDAKAAISHTGELFPGEAVTILTVWHRFVDTMARMGGGIGVIVDYDEVDKATQENAATQAAEGAKLASEAGLDATPCETVVDTTLADAILTQAAAVDAKAVVCGSRGYTGVKSLMLGSVSSQILQHADIPVIVVPSPAVAAARAEHRRELSA